jgi:hypothetical protein
MSSSACRYLIALAMACSVIPAQAQTSGGSAAALRSSCAKDYATFCSGGKGDSAAIQRACLRQNFMSLSDRCKQAMRAMSAPQTQSNE